MRPALADNDGPFMKFRKWYAQFYAEPASDERLVYPPPLWPDKMDDAPAKATASAKLRPVADRYQPPARVPSPARWPPSTAYSAPVT